MATRSENITENLNRQSLTIRSEPNIIAICFQETHFKAILIDSSSTL